MNLTRYPLETFVLPIGNIRGTLSIGNTLGLRSSRYTFCDANGRNSLKTQVYPFLGFFLVYTITVYEDCIDSQFD